MLTSIYSKNSWPTHIVNLFSNLPADKKWDETHYYGPYNAALNELFPSKEGYLICPQNCPQTDTFEPNDYRMLYRVEKRGVPVLFVEIRPAGSLDMLSSRIKADKQMRARFGDFVEKSISKLYGFSAMGTKICVYTLNRRNNCSLVPIRIPESENELSDRAPAARWSLDFLENYVQIQAIIDEVKAIVQAEGIAHFYNFFDFLVFIYFSF